MIKGRDSKGCFIKGNVPWNKRRDSSASTPVGAEVGSVPGKVYGGGVLKLERVQVTCPACRQKIEAIARNGRVKGYCAVANQYVDFRV